MDIKSILQFLGFLTVTCYAVIIPLALYLSRKTDFFERFNNWIDSLVDDKAAADDRLSGPAVATALAADPADQDPVPGREELQKEGVASFSIMVKDRYYCMPSTIDTESRIHPLDWMTDNEFVGQMDSEAVFTGQKAGRTIVSCVRKGDRMDPGTAMYEIDVVPSNPKWFAEKSVASLGSRKNKAAVLSSLAGHKILSENPARKIIVFEGKGEARKISVQFNHFDELERVLYELKNIRETETSVLEQELNDRFEEIPLIGTGIRIWTKRIIDTSKDEVVLYAFLREYQDGRRFLGIGQTWREYGEIDEFLLNVGMAEKMFRDLLPGTVQASVSAIIPEKEVETEPVPENIAGTPEENVDTYDKIPVPPSFEPDEGEEDKANEGSPEDEEGSVSDGSDIPPEDIPDINSFDNFYE